jgi:branched-chain amino acid transport system ATP-binding protein
LAFLEIKEVSKDFGGLNANKEISFAVEEKEIVGLIGPNGAGKTTLFNCIVGYYKPNSGKILFRGNDITGFKPFQTNRFGIGRTFQTMRVTTGLTVLENVMVGAFCRQDNRSKAKDQASEVLAYLGLSEVGDYHLNELPIAMQRKVGLARALATGPELLMLDEVASGLNPSETEEMIGLLKRLNGEKRITILLIEHIMEMVMSVSGRVVVLDSGQKIAEGLPGEIVRNKDVIKAYLGEKYVKGL